jgi:hypothetical protein
LVQHQLNTPPGTIHCKNPYKNKKASSAINASVMRFFAALTELGLPPAIIYWIPPTIIAPVTTTPTPAPRKLIILFKSINILLPLRQLLMSVPLAVTPAFLEVGGLPLVEQSAAKALPGRIKNNKAAPAAIIKFNLKILFLIVRMMLSLVRTIAKSIQIQAIGPHAKRGLTAKVKEPPRQTVAKYLQLPANIPLVTTAGITQLYKMIMPAKVRTIQGWSG